ncbi:aldo/keto reductase [Priestia filamentosa]|uniref:aldo/keto reductase n=1 Tax=Priestia filamentosa TaxID=1402861 RepID=UPI000E760D6A|nr:aldo/keto reductase [Priestia filamentosa]RJS66881.1 oxidoreductase [Priestia filamentosa]
MEKRRLGRSDLHVSVMGLGCMSLGQDREKAKSIIDGALEQGVNYLDTADLYDFGTNEELVGEAIKGRRKDLILATKVGNKFEKGKEGWTWDPSKAHIKESVKKSLQRLQTDYIDLYQLHGGTIEDPIDETIEAFEELKKEGLIREYGISSIRPNVIREYVEKSSIVSVMMQYSILDRRPEESIEELLAEHNISIVARGPLAKGLLTSRGTDQLQRKFYNKDYLNYKYEDLERTILHIANVRPTHSLEQTALQYCLHNKAVASVIAGASSVEQVLSNTTAAGSLPLKDSEVEDIKRLTKANQYESYR